MEQPFMEHPTGDFETAVAAMNDAIARLRMDARWPAAIVFNAQGFGGKPDVYQIEEVRLEGHCVSVDGGPIDLPAIRALAGVGPTAIVAAGSGYSLGGATSAEAAAVLDAIFRHHLGITPFPGEGSDYAVGAEWAE
jgi:hypothetical protein